MAKKHHILRTDKSQSDVTELRGRIGIQAEKIHLPDRFETIDSIDSPTVWIKDKETGRTTQVPLCGYSAVRKTLNDLFGKE